MRSCRGISLIELLIAISIAVILLALVLSMYRTISMTTSSQKDRGEESLALNETMMSIHNDLMRAFLPAEDPACAFWLSATNDVGNAFSSLSFCLASLRGENSIVEYVEYYASPINKRTALINSRRDMAGPASVQPPMTNVLVCPITEFSVEVFDGTNWMDHWSSAEVTGLPKAARLRMATEKKSGVTEIFIPAGNNFTSRVQRTADFF